MFAVAAGWKVQQQRVVWQREERRERVVEVRISVLPLLNVANELSLSLTSSLEVKFSSRRIVG